MASPPGAPRPALPMPAIKTPGGPATAPPALPEGSILPPPPRRFLLPSTCHATRSGSRRGDRSQETRHATLLRGIDVAGDRKSGGRAGGGRRVVFPMHAGTVRRVDPFPARGFSEDPGQGTPARGLPALVLLHLFADLLDDVRPALFEGGTVRAGGQAAALDFLLGPLLELGLADVLGGGDAALVGGGLFVGLLLAALGVLLLLGVVGGQKVVQGVAGLLGLLRGGRRRGAAQLLLQLRDFLAERGLLLLEVGFDAGEFDQSVGLLLGGGLV